MVSIVFFVVFMLFSIFRASFQSIDVTVNLWVLNIHTDTATLLAKVISVAFDTTIIAAASLLIASFLFIKNRKAQSVILLTALSGSVLVAIIKNVTQVARPENQLLPGSGFSYPSGHSASTIIFIGLMVYYIWLNWNSSQRVKLLSLTSFGLVVALVGFDRIYLNVHWLSDVVGGWLFGAFWLSFCIMAYEQLKLAGKFESKKFNFIANLLFALGIIVIVLIVILGPFLNIL